VLKQSHSCYNRTFEETQVASQEIQLYNGCQDETMSSASHFLRTCYILDSKEHTKGHIVLFFKILLFCCSFLWSFGGSWFEQIKALKVICVVVINHTQSSKHTWWQRICLNICFWLNKAGLYHNNRESYCSWFKFSPTYLFVMPRPSSCIVVKDYEKDEVGCLYKRTNGLIIRKTQ